MKVYPDVKTKSWKGRILEINIVWKMHSSKLSCFKKLLYNATFVKISDENIYKYIFIYSF